MSGIKTLTQHCCAMSPSPFQGEGDALFAAGEGGLVYALYRLTEKEIRIVVG